MPLLLILMVSLTLAGCGSDSEGGSAEFNGLWTGTITETVGATDTEFAVFLLFDGPNVFVLREDEALIGDYEDEGNGHLTIDSEVFSYATPDTDNNVYVGVRSNSRIEIESLFATEITLYGTYEATSRTGSMSLDLDTGLVDDINIERVTGTWETTDSVLYINDLGGFIGNGNDCRWEGDITGLSNTFLKLNIERQGAGCDTFLQPENSLVEGLAFIDGEGSLHFLVHDNNNLLWQQFDAAAATAVVAEEEGTAE